FDPLFQPCSYAFRSAKVLKKSYSHHSAIEDIIEYKKKINLDTLWVSECDIKKFYDCVNHQVVSEVFDEIVDACLKLGLKIDSRAISLFYSYLECYSFNFDVKNIKLGLNKEFGWVENSELMGIGSDPNKVRIGVPQGGAISCLIANLLMNVVDKKVMDSNIDGLLFY